jgi:hypothetical protein
MDTYLKSKEKICAETQKDAPNRDVLTFLQISLLSNFNNLLLVIRTASLAYFVRHHKFAALAALYESRSAHLPVSSSLISSAL